MSRLSHSNERIWRSENSGGLRVWLDCLRVISGEGNADPGEIF